MTRGFQNRTPEQRREVARKGGRAVQAKGTGYRWTPQTARVASLKALANRRAKQVQGTSATAATPAQE